jgi:hypothetical protein
MLNIPKGVPSPGPIKQVAAAIMKARAAGAKGKAAKASGKVAC